MKRTRFSLLLLIAPPQPQILCLRRLFAACSFVWLAYRKWRWRWRWWFEGKLFTAAAARVNPNCDVTTMSIHQHRNMLVEEDAVTS